MTQRPERLWFQQPIEGQFLRGLGEKLTPELRAVVKGCGIDLDRLQPGYPVEVMERTLKTLAPLVFPTLSTSEAMWEFGRAFLRGYSQTFLGGAMVGVMKAVGPRRTLERMQKNFRTGTNFIETRFTSTGPNSAELWFNDGAGTPEFFAGVVEQGASFVDSKGTKVVLHEDVSPAFRLTITWEG